MVSLHKYLGNYSLAELIYKQDYKERHTAPILCACMLAGKNLISLMVVLQVVWQDGAFIMTTIVMAKAVKAIQSHEV